MNKQDHILVLDDDHEIREFLTDYLRDAGFNVSEATNGSEMCLVLNEEPVNLIGWT